MDFTCCVVMELASLLTWKWHNFVLFYLLLIQDKLFVISSSKEAECSNLFPKALVTS